MRLTDQEARTKLCHATFDSGIKNCVASGCMAWRWLESIPHTCIKCGTEEMEWVDVPEQRKGYCGLAGKPEV